MVAVSASVLTAGTVAIAAAYQAGISFDLSGKDRDIRTNQVVFADDETSNHKEDSEKRESELFKSIRAKTTVVPFVIRRIICLTVKNN